MSDQPELWEAEIHWFHVMKELVKTKVMADMDGSTLKVYMAIKAFANHYEGQAFPSYETLMEYAGVTEPTLKKALRELEGLSLLERRKSGRKNVYELRERVQIKEAASGELAAYASFKYVPMAMGKALDELKKVILKDPMLNNGQTIHIERLNLTLINNFPDSKANVNVNNGPVDKISTGEK